MDILSVEIKSGRLARGIEEWLAEGVARSRDTERGVDCADGSSPANSKLSALRALDLRVLGRASLSFVEASAMAKLTS